MFSFVYVCFVLFAFSFFLFLFFSFFFCLLCFPSCCCVHVLLLFCSFFFFFFSLSLFTFSLSFFCLVFLVAFMFSCTFLVFTNELQTDEDMIAELKQTQPPTSIRVRIWNRIVSWQSMIQKRKLRIVKLLFIFWKKYYTKIAAIIGLFFFCYLLFVFFSCNFPPFLLAFVTVSVLCCFLLLISFIFCLCTSLFSSFLF